MNLEENVLLCYEKREKPKLNVKNEHENEEKTSGKKLKRVPFFYFLFYRI
jgi:hypothetical protein